MTNLTDYEKLALQKLGQSIHQGKWSNEGMVQLIELIGQYLQPLTIANYAAKHGISYNGAKNHRKTTNLLGVKMIIDNE